MDVVRDSNGTYQIVHAGKVIDREFTSEDEAWTWADHNIDDQVFDAPNWFSEPLPYRKSKGAA